MSQRAALLISIALTVVTLLGGIGVAVRVMEADTTDASPDVATLSTSDPEADTIAADQIDELERLQTFNSALTASYQRIAALLDTVDALQSQNSALRDREAVYQERLAEANRRLASVGQEAIIVPPAGAGTVATSPAPVDAEQATSPPAAVAASLTADDAAIAVHQPAERAQPPVVVVPAVVPAPAVVAAPVQPQRTAESPTVRPSVASSSGAGLPTTHTPVISQATAPQAGTAARGTTPSNSERPVSTLIRPLIPTITSQVSAAVQAAQSRERRESERHTEASDGRRKSRDGDRD